MLFQLPYKLLFSYVILRMDNGGSIRPNDQVLLLSRYIPVRSPGPWNQLFLSPKYLLWFSPFADVAISPGSPNMQPNPINAPTDTKTTRSLSMLAEIFNSSPK